MGVGGDIVRGRGQAARHFCRLFNLRFVRKSFWNEGGFDEVPKKSSSDYGDIRFTLVGSLSCAAGKATKCSRVSAVCAVF